MNHQAIARRVSKLQDAIGAGDADLAARRMRELVRAVRRQEFYEARDRRVATDQARLIRELRRWLQDHPAAWSGWPTWRARFRDDVRARERRLAAHGCPGPLRRHIHQADTAIAELRVAHRERYGAKVERLQLGVV